MNKIFIQVGGLITVGLMLAVSGAQAAPGDYTNLVALAGGANGGQWAMAAPLADGATLYGMAQLGGAANKGVLYRVGINGAGYTNLVAFNGTNGAYPIGRLILNGGYLYGMTPRGGTWNNGVIFRVATNGSGYTVLHHFCPTNRNDGAMPWGALAIGDTNLYGMTCYGGATNYGVIFRVTLTGTGYTNLYSFAGGAGSGKHPKGDLLLDGGTLYGMTAQGGAADAGVVFRLAVSGTGYTNLHAFSGNADGEGPAGGLIRDGAYLYGMARGGAGKGGIVFSLSTNGGTLNILKSFDGSGQTGCDPFGTLVKHDSKWYGLTRYGGTNFAGVLFALGGSYTHQYTWPKGVGEPLADPVFIGDQIYSTTLKGGTGNCGAIFRFDAATTDTATAWAAMTWIENGQLAPVTAGDYSGDRLWVKHNTAAGLPDFAYVGYGRTQNFDDKTWKWVPLTEYGMMGADYEFTGRLGRAAAGSYYVAAKFIKGAHVYYTQAGFGSWGDWSTALWATNRWTVNPLKAPSNCTATAAGSNQINLAWAGDGSHWVAIFRKTTNSFSAPLDGIEYTAGWDYADQGKCIYRGSAVAFADTDLTPGQTYYYRFYTENYGYYSTGCAASATTAGGGAKSRQAPVAEPEVLIAEYDGSAGVGILAGADAPGGLTEPAVLFADDFNGALNAGWLADADASVDWFVTGQGTLRAQGAAPNSYSYLVVTNLNVADRDIVLECDIRYDQEGSFGGLIYRGCVLYVNPALCGWVDRNPAYKTLRRRGTTKVFHHLRLVVRMAEPYPMTDLFVDGVRLLRREPVETAQWLFPGVGLLSTYGVGAVEFDNVVVRELLPVVEPGGSSQ